MTRRTDRSEQGLDWSGVDRDRPIHEWDQCDDLGGLTICCALRMDGYKYVEENPFDHDAMEAHFRRTGSFDGLPIVERMVHFFMLQRFLHKWGGDYLSCRSLSWRMYRIHFLDLAERDVPAEYRFAEYYERWERHEKHRLPTVLPLIRWVHVHTDYADEDVLDESLQLPTTAQQETVDG